MDLIRASLQRPIAVVSAVIMVVLSGFVALQTIPIQLTPDVRRPVLTVNTSWSGAAPAEIEREIINRQEEVLRGLEGVEQMISRSRNEVSDQVPISTGVAGMRREFARLRASACN